jgi:hypothetical protein
LFETKSQERRTCEVDDEDVDAVDVDDCCALLFVFFGAFLPPERQKKTISATKQFLAVLIT